MAKFKSNPALIEAAQNALELQKPIELVETDKRGAGPPPSPAKLDGGLRVSVLLIMVVLATS